MAIVNLGNNKLNINTTTAKGLEKVIGVIAKFVISAQTKSNLILYGKGVQNPKAKGLEKVTQKGVLGVIKEIADVDFCNLLNYVATQITPGKKNRFNPNGPAENSTPFQKRIWTIQNYAFKIQSKIDQYYSEYGSTTGQDSRLGLLEFITSINLEMRSLLSPTEGLNDPEILKQFPEMSTATNYLSNALNKFNSYTSVRDIPLQEVQKALNFIDKLRIICTSIVALNNPAILINGANIVTGGKVQQDFNKINQYITPGPKIIILLENIIKKVNNINTVAKKILGYVNLARTIIKLALLLIKIFSILRKFLFAIPLPAAFIPVGAATLAADVSQNTVKEQGIDKPIKRLQQLNLVLNLISIFVTSLVAALNSIIQDLTAILLNIKSCSSNLSDSESELQNLFDENANRFLLVSDNTNIINKLQKTIDDLSNTRSELQKFLDDYNNSKNLIDRTFGGYTIEIITEEVTDEGISLRRRYGIARGANNIIAVQSTPTFASLDLIIINEVKVLLVSKGLVNVGPGGLSSQDSQIIVESLNYLGDQDITLNDVDFNPVQVSDLFDDSNAPNGSRTSQVDPDLEESNITDITKFTNNLPGGKALRDRVRKRLIRNNQKLVANLKATDPNSTYSKNIIKEKENETTKLKIQKLEEEKSVLQKSLLLAASNPLGAAAIIAKIKDIDNQIKDLKNNLK